MSLTGPQQKNGRFCAASAQARRRSWTAPQKMVRIGPMASPKSLLDRRELMAGLGAAALLPIWPAHGPRPRARRAGAAGQSRRRLRFAPGRAGNADLVARPARNSGSSAATPSRSPSATSCRCPRPSIGGASTAPPAVEPLTARAPLAAGGKEALQLPLRHAGTFLCDLGLLGDGQARPSRARALVVRESETVAVDRDEVLLVEDWRLRAGRNRDRARSRPQGCRTGLYDQRPAFARYLSATNERLRLRFINGCQRSVIAIKIENLDVRVMAIDGQPAEPFQARNGALVLAPGGRVDAFIDVTAPAGTTSRSCCTTARRPARSAGSSSPANRRSAPPRCHRRRRCPPTACRSSSTSRAPRGSIWPSAGRRATG